MTAGLIVASDVMPHAARARRGAGAGSTSIRVSVRTRDILARQATASGMGLGAYLDGVARDAERQRVFAEFRASEAAALRDPSYVAELMEWEEMEDGSGFDGE